MGDSISELIDENQKAAEALLVHVETTLTMTERYDTFLHAVTNLANHDAIYHCHETMRLSTFRVEDADAKLQKHHDTALEHLATAHEKAEGATQQLRRLSDEVLRVSRDFSSQVEKMNSEATEFANGIHQGVGQIDEHWTKIDETLKAKHDESIQAVEEFSEVIEQQRNDLHDLAGKLETELQELGTALDGHTAHVLEILQDLTDTADNKMQSITGSTDTLPGASDLKDVLHKEFERMHAEIIDVDEKFLGRMNDLIESAGKGQRSLHEAVSNVQEQIEGVTAILDEVQPLLQHIEDIE